MESPKKFQKRVIIRLFVKQWKIIQEMVIHCRTKEGDRRYTNISHFLRCAIMNEIDKERPNTKIMRGRPRK